jgi:hypothetical protein
MIAQEIIGNICSIDELSVFNKNALNSVTHICNCQGVFNKGLAKSIRTKYPVVYDEYMKLCSTSAPQHLLGTLQPVQVSQNIFFCNLFGQLNYGTQKRQLNYESLYLGLESQANMARNTPHAEFYYPKNMGSVLAGGNWYIVLSIINGLFKDLPNKVYIVNLG